MLRCFPWSRVLPATLLALGLASGCATFLSRSETLIPSQSRGTVGPFQIYTADRATAASATAALGALQQRVEQTLGFRVDPELQPIAVYILADEDSFKRFLTYHHPKLPPRRAFFLGRDDERVIYTFQGERLEEDLRHEATHALLHAAVGTVPLWLDEGLAEYFEVPADDEEMEQTQFAQLVGLSRKGWRPDLNRLEGLGDVRELTPRDYLEAWAWTHFLLRDSPATKSLLLDYLGDLRAVPMPPPLSDRLATTATKQDAGDAARLLAHIHRGGRPDPTPTPTRVARFQQNELVIKPSQRGPSEIVIAVEPQRRRDVERGLFGRVLDGAGNVLSRLRTSRPPEADRSWPPR